MKEWLNCRRILISSGFGPAEKLFATFVSLIYLSYIKSLMQKHELPAEYTLLGLLDESDVIECFRALDKSLIPGDEKAGKVMRSYGSHAAIRKNWFGVNRNVGCKFEEKTEYETCVELLLREFCGEIVCVISLIYLSYIKRHKWMRMIFIRNIRCKHY